MERDWLTEASARGYCTKENEHKEVDAILLKAIVDEIKQAIAELAPPEKECPTGAYDIAWFAVRNAYRVELFRKLNIKEGK